MDLSAGKVCTLSEADKLLGDKGLAKRVIGNSLL
jgi:hypothetical protein